MTRSNRRVGDNRLQPSPGSKSAPTWCVTERPKTCNAALPVLSFPLVSGLVNTRPPTITLFTEVAGEWSRKSLSQVPGAGVFASEGSPGGRGESSESGYSGLDSTARDASKRYRGRYRRYFGRSDRDGGARTGCHED